MKCQERFYEIYCREPDDVAFCPYRVCPVGAHSDHQLGKVTGFAIDRGIYLAYSPKRNGVIELTSLQFDKRAQWHISATPKDKQNDWADYLRGAVVALSKEYTLSVGLCGVIEGTLPIGGLSSSSAIIISFLSALCKVNGIKLTEKEMIKFSKSAENKYVGVACGKLDQSCEVYSKKNHLLYLDTLDDSFCLLPVKNTMKPFKFAIFFSGVERNLTVTKYNMRVDECRAAAYALKAFSKMEYGKFEDTNLREVPYEVFEEYKDKLPELWRRRAEFWYAEFHRVEKAKIAWENGDIEAFGKISFESGHDSIYKWETGSPELKKLYDIMLNTDGIYGGRFSGAGFKGCCMAIINPEFEEKILNYVKREYLKEFPALKEKYTAYICESADGVKL